MKTSVIVAIGLGMVALAAAPAQAKDPPGVNPTHYLCYRVTQSLEAQAGGSEAARPIRRVGQQAW